MSIRLSEISLNISFLVKTEKIRGGGKRNHGTRSLFNLTLGQNNNPPRGKVSGAGRLGHQNISHEKPSGGTNFAQGWHKQESL